MKYCDLHIQTQREFPNNTRTQGFGWLVRSGYLTRENELTPLGEYAVDHIHTIAVSDTVSFFSRLWLKIIHTEQETFFPIHTGSEKIIHCPACKYSARKELALFQKSALPGEEPLPAEKVLTPDCHTIESLAEYLHLPKEKTAKAMMFTQVPSGKFVFVVLRGDMNLSETKFRNVVGEVRLATTGEIEQTGAVAGYASPVGLEHALIVVDDLIPQSSNLVAGANEAGFHLLNTNCGRDYQADIVTDLALAGLGDPCAMCGNLLEELSCISLKDKNGYQFKNILLALADAHHDDKGLTFPGFASPFDGYLMHIPGKTLDTRARAEAVYLACQRTGIQLLFDDREERAGVKFNDADLIGCPVRITIGERNLENGLAELKTRKTGESMNISLDAIPEQLKKLPAS